MAISLGILTQHFQTNPNCKQKHFCRGCEVANWSLWGATCNGRWQHVATGITCAAFITNLTQRDQQLCIARLWLFSSYVWHQRRLPNLSLSETRSPQAGQRPWQQSKTFSTRTRMFCLAISQTRLLVEAFDRNPNLRRSIEGHGGASMLLTSKEHRIPRTKKNPHQFRVESFVNIVCLERLGKFQRAQNRLGSVSLQNKVPVFIICTLASHTHINWCWEKWIDKKYSHIISF